MAEFKTVSKEEFYKFILKYPSQSSLSVGTTTICEPPIRHYHDRSLPSKGVLGSADFFFDTEVARIVLEWIGPDGVFETGDKYFEYKIREGM